MKASNKPEISVIIPVYNSEDSILRCLSSVQDQTFNNIEIICIDDCSKDDTNRILKELALKDKRIILLENERNVGPGVSRNKGIDIASGDYLIFIDADDYIDIDLFEVLHNKAISGSFDIVSGVKKNIRRDGEVIEKNKKHDIEKGISDGMPLWFLFRYHHHGVLFKKELFDDEQIRYGSTYVSEDSIFLLKVGHKTNSIGFLDADGPFYYRVQTLGSLTNNYDSRDKINDLVKGFHERMEYLMPEAYEDYTIDYFVDNVKYLLNIHRIISTYNEDTDLPRDFLRAIKNEANCFPNIESIKKNDFIIRALIDYDVNLFASSNLLHRNTKDITHLKNNVKEWISFAQKHPELSKEWKLELINLLTRKKLKDSNTDHDYSDFLDNELERCTSFTKMEKFYIRVLSRLRMNNTINRTLSKMKRNMNKIIK